MYIILYHSSIPLVMHSCISPLEPIGQKKKKPPVPLCTDYSIKMSENTSAPTRGR